MKPTPPGWPRIAISLYYADANQAIEWLCNAFGFEVRLKVEGDNGKVEHSELVYGDGLIMVSEADKRDRFPYRRAPSEIEGANTQNLMVYVDDVAAHCAHARACGAVITDEPATHDYGPEYWTDRGYACRDLGGHHWWFYQRLHTGGKA